MVAVFLNCLYAGGKLKPPFFKGHLDNFQRKLTGQEQTPVIVQKDLYEAVKENARPDFRFYIIPKEIEETFISKYPTTRDAWKMYLSKEIPEYSEIIRQILEQIQNDFGEEIQAVLTYTYSPSLRRCCDEQKIPVIEFEYSPIRFTTCNYTLGYFCRENKFSSEECQRRYKRFQAEAAQAKVDYFTRKELLALFLQKRNLSVLYDYGKGEEYEIGIPLSPPDDCLQETWGACGNDELVKRATKLFGQSVLLRCHPEGMEDAKKYGLDLDTSPSSQQFTARCKRIATNISNVGFDAMLMGKSAYMLGEMPFSFAACRTLEQEDDFVCGNQFLNYMIFGFFVPFDLMHQVDYVKWRLSGPGEVEIFTRHRDYIFHELFKKMPQAAPGGNERLNLLLSLRGEKPYHPQKWPMPGLSNGKSDWVRQEKQYLEKIRSMREEEWVWQQLTERDQEIFRLEMQLAQFQVLKGEYR